MAVSPELAARAGFRTPIVAALAPALLLIAEIVALDAIYDVRVVAQATPLWLAVNEAAKHTLYAGLYAFGAFVLIMAPRRAALSDAWRQAPSPGRAPWAINLALFALLAVAASAARASGALSWAGFAALAAGCVLLAATATLAAASPRFWLRFLRAHAGEIALALVAGAFVALAAALAQNSWSALSGATLQLSYAILAAFDPRAVMAADARLLGVGEFRVIIDSYCSGYEGVGLVLSALGLYILLFRKQLRFPNVLWLLPLGAGAIWLLNSVRIAALVGIGAYLSPEIALRGFHSQAGWILFLAVTASLMAWSHASPLFRAGASAAPRDPALRLAVALVAPFAALMGARMLGGVFGAEAPLWAAALIGLPLAVLIGFRRTLAPLLGALRLDAVLVGLAVGGLWIVTEPAADPGAGPFAAQEPFAASLWLTLRLLGFVLIVPVAEELLFRGYLHRALTRRRFEAAGQGAFSWPAFLVTSVLFGALHQRWLAGALAGAAYALVLYRARAVGAPIAAHIASNGLIAAYAIVTGSWNYL